MKIAYLIGKYPSLSHTFILREIQQLEQMGWDVGIVSINAADRPLAQLLPEERVHAERTYYVKQDAVKGALYAIIKSLIVNPVGFASGLASAIRIGGWNLKELALFVCYFIEALMVTEWMRANSYKHLHVHFAGQTASIAMLSKKIANHYKQSVTVHGPDELSDVSRQRLQHKFATADLIVCITNYAQSRVFLHANYEDWQKTRIVRVGLDTRSFEELAACRKESGGANKKIRLLSIGRLAPAKGQLVMLEALAELKAAKCPIHLTLIGNGPLEPILTERARKLGLDSQHLTLTGGLNQNDVKKHLLQSDLFVLSSFAEGLPVVLMEALLSGLPCISTSIAGIPELIRPEKDGMLVPAGNSRALSEAIRMMVENPSLAAELARSGKERVLAMHDIRQTACNLSKCFTEVQQLSASAN